MALQCLLTYTVTYTMNTDVNYSPKTLHIKLLLEWVHFRPKFQILFI